MADGLTIQHRFDSTLVPDKIAIFSSLKSVPSKSETVPFLNGLCIVDYKKKCVLCPQIVNLISCMIPF